MPTFNNQHTPYQEEHLNDVVRFQRQEIDSLKQEIKILKTLVAEETQQKYEAYKKLASR